MAAIRARLPVLLAIGVMSLIFICSYAITGSVYQSWGYLGAPADAPSFLDLRLITNSIDCIVQGLDPYTNDACDTYARLYNYPSTWLHFSHLNVSSSSTNIIGVVFILFVCASFLLLFKVRTLPSGILAALAVASPPILFGLQRGNIDTFIFAVLVFAYFLIAAIKNDRIHGFVLSIVIAVATALKLYPAVAAVSCVRFKRGGVYFVLASAMSICVVIVFVGGVELRHIAANTPQPLAPYFYDFYGSRSVALAAMEAFSRWGLWTPTQTCVPAFAAGVSLFGLLVAVRLYTSYNHVLSRLFPPYNWSTQNQARHAIALAFYSIFCATFVAGANYDYRLIYLIGVLPPFLFVYDNQEEQHKAIICCPLVIVVFLWTSRFSTPLMYFDEIMDFAVYVFGVMYIYREILYWSQSGGQLNGEWASNSNQRGL